MVQNRVWLARECLGRREQGWRDLILDHLFLRILSFSSALIARLEAEKIFFLTRLDVTVYGILK
jgi:hypothetical protein